MEDLFGNPEVSRDTNYDHEPGKRYCAMLGIGWDEDFALRMDVVAFRFLELSQEEWDIALREYAWKVAYTWNPRTYTWWQRFKLAAHFINPLAKGLPEAKSKGE